MKRILVSTPLKGGLSSEYVAALIKLLNWKQADYQFEWAITKGTSVAMARCELAKLAIEPKNNFYKWIQWDKDLGPRNPNQMLSMFVRLLSHDVDIVGAPYVGHNVNSKFHGATDSKEIRPDGLMEMEQIPIGFSAIKVSALHKIKEAHPQFEYKMKQTDDTVESPPMFEFFPNGLVGPCTGNGKVERLKELLKTCETADDFMVDAIKIIEDTRYETNYMMGEDYYFCMLARTAGIKLYVDNNLIMPHCSEVMLPITNSLLMEEVLKPWRWKEEAGEVDAENVSVLLKKLLGTDHV